MTPDELSIIDRYFRPLAGEGAFGLRDDAAQLGVPPGKDLVVTADMLAAGVHFLPGDPPDTIARKALRVNLSDLAAKGAEPLAYILSLGLGGGVDDAWLAGFADGLRDDQEHFGIALLGGDTISAPAGPVISICALGLVSSGTMVHRFGGRVGDVLYVSGCIGAGAAGLALLKGKAGPWDAAGAAERDALVGSYRVPEPRLALAPALRAFATAAMDISDGLVGDCDKLAAASACAARIDAERVPVPAGVAGAGAEALAELLTGGDDYEILAAIDPKNEAAFRAAAAEVGVAVAPIGVLREGGGPTEVYLRGVPLPVRQRSYVHGAGDRDER